MQDEAVEIWEPHGFLTFKLSGRQRQDAGPGPVKLYSVPPAQAWCPGVGAPLGRWVTPHSAVPCAVPAS